MHRGIFSHYTRHYVSIGTFILQKLEKRQKHDKCKKKKQKKKKTKQRKPQRLHQNKIKYINNTCAQYIMVFNYE
jgi:hypothetical protein